MANTSKKTNFPDIIRRRYKSSKEKMQTFFDRAELNKNLYRGDISVDDSYEWEYSLVDPHVFPIMRNYLSRSNPMMNSLTLESTRPDADFVREINQKLVNWEINEIASTSLFYRMMFSGFAAGRGYAKTGWKYHKALKIEEKDEGGNVTRTKVLRNILNRSDAQFVRYNNILVPDRNIPTLQDQPFIIELVSKTVGEMLSENETLEEAGEAPYWKKDFLKKLKNADLSKKLLEYEVPRATDEDDLDDYTYKAMSVPMICMHTNDQENMYIPYEAGIYDGIVNEDMESQYWHGLYPFVDFTPFPEDDEYCSLSLIDVIGDLQIAATEVLNQTMTNIRQINNDMWIVGSAGAQTPDWQFKKRPDGVIRVMGDPNQVQQIRTQDNTRQAVGMAENLGVKIEKASGISSLYSSGAASESINQTARGAQIIDSNIDTNMKMILDLFGEQVLKSLGEQFLALNAQYITEDLTFAVTGRKGVADVVTIKPEEVTANFKVKVNSEKMQKQTPASRQASIQNTITVLQNFSNQSQGSFTVDIEPLADALLDATPELDDIEGIISSVDQKMMEDIQYLERGQVPPIKIKDPHEDLIVGVNVHFGDIDSYPPEVQEAVSQYVDEHLKHIQARQEVAIMKQPQLPQPMGAEGLQGQMGFNPDQAATQGLQTGIENPTYNLGSIAGG